MTRPTHPIASIEIARQARQRADEALTDAEIALGDAVLAEVRRALPGVALTVDTQGGGCVVWWREDCPDAIAIETRLRPDDPRRAGGPWRWWWEACATDKADDVIGRGATVREALDDMTQQDPKLEPLVAELYREVTVHENIHFVEVIENYTQPHRDGGDPQDHWIRRRVRVPSGWVYEVRSLTLTPVERGSYRYEVTTAAMAAVFVFDPEVAR
jgi:hypothetical protein